MRTDFGIPTSWTRPLASRGSSVLAVVAFTSVLTAMTALAASPTFLVRYRSAANVYLDGGKAQGLSIGDRLLVLAGSEAVAELEVIFLADESASCRVVSEKRPVRAGDSATVRRAAEPGAAEASKETPKETPPSPAPPTVTVRAKPATPRPWARVRGGLSLGLYKIWDTSGGGFDFEQRTGRVDLSLYEIGGAPLSFNTRFRSRRDLRTLSLSSRTPREERHDRLYELSLRYEPPSDNLAFEVGRLSSSRFSSIGYLDGGLLRIRLGSPLQIGGFFGQSADVDGLGPEGLGRKYGGFLRISPRNPYSASYEAVLALVREFAQEDVSREYVSIETRFGSGAVSFFERAEIDLNRGWRRDLAREEYQLSNLSVSTSFRFSPAASMVLSYDSRRNYRDYFTRDVPERIFDDLLHQGFRGSLYVGRGYGLNATAGFGYRLAEGETPASYSYNGGIRHGNLFRRDVTLGVDANGFQNDFTDGYLLSTQLGKRIRGRHQMDVGYGRSLYRVRATGELRRTEYLRFTGRGDLGRHFYVLTDVEYDRGDDIQGPRGFFEIGYQF